MAAKQHFNNFMIVVSGSRSEIKRLAGVEGREVVGGGGVLRGRRSKKKERSRKCLSQIKCFPPFFSPPSSFSPPLPGRADGGLDYAPYEPRH